jgi:hypothetical protein
MLPEAAAETGGAAALPLLLAVLVTGGPLLPYSVTNRAAVLHAFGRLLVCTVTCNDQGSTVISHGLKPS